MKRAIIFFCFTFLTSPAVPQKTDNTLSLPPVPIDLQVIIDQDNMTRDDYHPVPGINWADPGLVPQWKFRMALVAVDFPDQPFAITLPKNYTGIIVAPDGSEPHYRTLQMILHLILFPREYQILTITQLRLSRGLAMILCVPAMAF